MTEKLYFCRICGRHGFVRKAVHKSSPGALNSTCPGDFVAMSRTSCFTCEWMTKRACPDTRVIVHSPHEGCGAWTARSGSAVSSETEHKPMKIQTPKRGQAEAAGPFVIRRRRKAGQQLAGRVLYKQRRGGWSQDPEAAWKFDTEQAAKFVLRGNEGEVVSVEDLDGARPDGLAGVPQAGRTAGQAECEPGVFDVAPTATAGAVVLSGKLSASERERKTKLEGEIEEGRSAFIAVGQALVEIRERRLYRDEFGTFEDYMRVKWGFSARHGHRLCDAAEVMQNLLPPAGASDKLVTLPKTESQARELARLPAAEQRPAWEEARAAAPGGKVTARHVQDSVKRRIAKKSNSGNGADLDSMPEAPPFGPNKRELILVAASNAVRAIRSLENLCEPNHFFVLACMSARDEKW